MKELTTPQELAEVLTRYKTVAVVGFHPDPLRPAHYVPEYLQRRGYKIIPVNPILASRKAEYWGRRTVARLQDIREKVDIVNFFRRTENLSEHLDDLLRMHHKPKVVWLQLGIRNDEFARAIMHHGIMVVQDHCMLAEHRNL